MDLSFHKEALINRAPRVQLLIVRGIIYIYRQYIYTVHIIFVANVSRFLVKYPFPILFEHVRSLKGMKCAKSQNEQITVK